MLQVIYGRSVRRITLQRAITGKIVHFMEEVTLKDVLVLFDNLLWLQEKCSRDPDFQEKFGLHLKVQAYILKREKISKDTLPTVVRKLKNSFLNNFGSFQIPKRNVKQVIAQQYRLVELRLPRQPGVPKSKLPPAAYIGKGYRDKGTAKKPAFDGSPSWQEVAQSRVLNL